MFRHVVCFRLLKDKKEMAGEAKKRLLSLTQIEEVKISKWGWM